MPAEIVNLKRARKQKARTDKELQAAENRAVHGRSKAQRISDLREAARISRELDGARRDTGDGGGDDRT